MFYQTLTTFPVGFFLDHQSTKISFASVNISAEIVNTVLNKALWHNTTPIQINKQPNKTNSISVIHRKWRIIVISFSVIYWACQRHHICFGCLNRYFLEDQCNFISMGQYNRHYQALACLFCKCITMSLVRLMHTALKSIKWYEARIMQWGYSEVLVWC